MPPVLRARLPVRLRRPRIAGLGAALLLATGAAPLLTGCGSSSSSLEVSIAPDTGSTGSIRPGDTPTYTVTIVNRGPGQATGVAVRVDLPADFHYATTRGIAGNITHRSHRDPKDPTATEVVSGEETTAVRTQPGDPQARGSNPQWQQWSLSAPGTDADGSPRWATLQITFSVRAGGTPGDYALVPHVFSDSVDGENVGKAAAVHLVPAADLTMTVVPEPSQLSRGDSVTIRVTVTNKGSGPAQGVSVLVLLPTDFPLDSADQTGGNATRGDHAAITPHTLLGYFNNYTIPARSDAGPGILILTIRAHCLRTAYAGTETINAQLTDQDGRIVTPDTLPAIRVNAPAAPTPSPSSSPR